MRFSITQCKTTLYIFSNYGLFFEPNETTSLLAKRLNVIGSINKNQSTMFNYLTNRLA